MKLKNLLCGSLLIGAGLALTHQLSARTEKSNTSAQPNSYESVDAYVEEQMRRLHIPGASLAIVKGKRLVHYRGFGQARPGGEAPAAQTPFFIGSLTKSITAMAVMQLVEAGKVELDAPVKHYLPWFRVADPAATEQMNVRHLLNQTSGFSSIASNVILANLDNRPGATERQVRALASVKLNHPLGEQLEYSNMNYNILGLIIEAASGEQYADYIQEHIFNPLDMRHSYTSKAAAQQDGLARGHRHWFGFPVPAPDLPIPRGSLPSGQLIACAEDMAHYLIAHLNGGQYRKTQVVSAHGIEELQRGVLAYINFGSSAGRYAMGWFDKDIGTIRTLSHGGNVPDYSAFMSLIPEQKLGLVLLLNADPYGLPMITDEIGTNLATFLIGQQPEAIKLDFIQWIFRLLPLIPLLQIWSVIATIQKVKHWQQTPASRPGGGRLWFQYILLPLIPNLSLAALLSYLRSSRLINFMDLFMPDLAWIIRISGGFAAGWAFVRTRLILQALLRTGK